MKRKEIDEQNPEILCIRNVCGQSVEFRLTNLGRKWVKRPASPLPGSLSAVLRANSEAKSSLVFTKA